MSYIGRDHIQESIAFMGPNTPMPYPCNKFCLFLFLFKKLARLWLDEAAQKAEAGGMPRGCKRSRPAWVQTKMPS